MQTIPSGPAWAVAMALIFTGLSLLLKAGVPVVQAIRRNGKNGRNEALERQEAVAEIKAHIDDTSKEARDRQDKIMGNIDKTRHDLSTPLATIALTVALMEQTLIEIRDDLRRG